jgi:ribonucleoside-triphosphate reductase
MLNVQKRDGRIVPFDNQKIINAILAAFKQVDGEVVSQYAIDKATNIADYIEGYYEEVDETPHIEEIQDLVEKGLMATKRKDVAKAYVLYREERTKERNRKTKLMQTIAEKLNAINVQNQNANVDEHSFGGRRGEATNELMKDIALNYIMSPMARDNHLNNEVYTHDLDSYAVGMHNCLTIPFDDLLAKGFNTRQADVRPAASINTAFQLVAVIFQLQSLQQFGGVSASHLDWTMVPYVRKSFRKHFNDGMKYVYEKNNFHFVDDNVDLPIEDKQYKSYPKAYKYAMDMTEKELMQAVEGMYHNLNTLQSRSGNQLPFTSINYGTCTSVEGRMVIKALLEGSIKGTGKHHKTSIFPCGIFQLGKGINREPGDPNYDLYQLALKSTAQRLYPNYANIDWSGNAGYDINDPKTYFSTMGCRTANGWDANGLGQQKDGRGNIAPVTIIMPTLAAQVAQLDTFKDTSLPCQEEIIEAFMELLDKKIHEAKDQLIERFEFICSQPSSSAKFMYENGLMAGYDGKDTRSALKHGTVVIGQLGLAETLQILLGCDHTEERGMELAKRIEQLFKDRCAEFKKEYSLNFGVYYTPAENLCYTAMKKFREKYGIIKNVSDRDFFTNSMHVPVWKEMSPFDKIDIESQLTGYSSAGCITYIELDSGIKNNLQALEQIVNYAMDKDIPYFAVNVPVDECLDCGYSGEFNSSCPECGSENIQQLRRVTGYLTGNYKTAFNKGKQQEVQMRVKHG